MKNPRQDAIEESPAATESHACARCGRTAEHYLGGMWVCEECRQIRGSCCLEFGGDDLWQEREERDGSP